MPEQTHPDVHDELPLFNTETWLYEDFEIGVKIKSIRRTISEGEAMIFNGIVLDQHPYVADEIFGTDMAKRPFEIIRVGGDEIMFLTKKGDSRMNEFFQRYNQKKKEFLIKEIGLEGYNKAKFETNIKGQMKLVTKEDGYAKAAEKGDVKSINAYLRSELETAAENEHRTGDLLRMLAEKRYQKLTKDPNYVPLEPLDFYRAPSKVVDLNRTSHFVRIGLMEDVAKADKDIAWLKAHPGKKRPPKEYEMGKIRETAGKYLDEAEDVEGTIRKIQGKEQELIGAEKIGDLATVEEIKSKIIRLETQDPGSGAIRLDKARDHKLNRFIELPKGATHVEVTRVDVPYFGIFNNHFICRWSNPF